MLLTFLYHRVNEGKYSSSKDIMQNHLIYLKNHYKIVVPKDKINPFKLNICLTFDDGYYDFYKFVFPLLKKLNIQAVLAIPIKYILDDTNVDPNIRLSCTYHEAMKDDNFITKAPFCTWKEIQEMVDSKLVKIASHSYTHKNLLKDKIDLNKEILESKNFLQNKLNIEVDTFVYPLGKFNEDIHKFAKRHYKYVMRIGSAINFSWQNITGITYRIISDNLKSENEYLKPKKFISYLWFFFLNTFRRR
ncbi:MAG: polysaccharide deacetylase family protein [Parachlamydiales bacterium]|nr:polysaccharide deacetylase family protein [Parachlamydiales bacterium]